MSKIDLFSVYLNQELKVEKDVSAGKVILYLACYKNFNKFVRCDDSLNELSKNDGYLTKCLSQFDQVEYCNVDSDNLVHYCFYPVLEFVVSELLSNKALLLPDLYKKFEDLVDKQQVSLCFSLYMSKLYKHPQCSTPIFRVFGRAL
jgi:hypothetical protein